MSKSTELVRGLYASFSRGDLPGFLEKLDARVVWNEAEGFPYSDRNPHVGPDAIVTGVFQRLGADWNDFHVEVGEIVGGEEVVTMFGRYRGRAMKSGRELNAQCAHTWWIRGGKVVRFQQMVDTAHVASNLA